MRPSVLQTSASTSWMMLSFPRSDWSSRISSMNPAMVSFSRPCRRMRLSAYVLRLGQSTLYTLHVPPWPTHSSFRYLTPRTTTISEFSRTLGRDFFFSSATLAAAAAASGAAAGSGFPATATDDAGSVIGWDRGWALAAAALTRATAAAVLGVNATAIVASSSSSAAGWVPASRPPACCRVSPFVTEGTATVASSTMAAAAKPGAAARCCCWRAAISRWNRSRASLVSRSWSGTAVGGLGSGTFGCTAVATGTPYRPCSMASFISSTMHLGSGLAFSPLARIFSAFSSPLYWWPNAAHSVQYMPCLCQNPSDLRYLNVSLASSMLDTICCLASPR
mmetsp:Transcript_13347/g.56421  ORF Transcript_13347/g.56421 Transcript_13347/m.56421 type:complete len:335 (-) Transcript_13347:904-1908(-)